MTSTAARKRRSQGRVAWTRILFSASAFCCLSLRSTASAFATHEAYKPRDLSPTRLSVYNPSGLAVDELEQLRSIGGPKADTYGEMTHDGLRSMAAQLRCFGPDAVFVDLGSGYGSLVLQAAKEFRVMSAGIELSEERHNRAIQSLAAEPDGGVHELVSFVLGNAAGEEAARLVESATTVWCSNLCFNNELNDTIANLIANHGSNTVQTVVSLTAFPNGIDGFDFDSTRLLPIEMSWTANKQQPGHPPLPGHPCCVYHRKC